MNRKPFYRLLSEVLETDELATSEVAMSTYGKRIASFQVITDTHLTVKPEHLYNRHWEMALSDIAQYGQGSLGIIHVGDVTDHGLSTEYAEMQRIWQKYRQKLPPIYFTMGNHDVGNLGWEKDLAALLGSSESELFALLKEDPQSLHKLWQHRLQHFNRATATQGSYAHHEIGGYAFIFLGTERPLGKDCYLSTEQLKWLEGLLSDLSESSSSRPIFMFLHQPLMNTVSGSLTDQGWYGVEQDEELRRIVEPYPQVMLFSGHTHWQLGSLHTIQPNSATGGPVMLNASSVAYLWSDEDTYLEGSEGYYIDIYPGHIRIRGRDFVNGAWINEAEYILSYKE